MRLGGLHKRRSAGAGKLSLDRLIHWCLSRKLLVCNQEAPAALMEAGGTGGTGNEGRI